MINEMIGLDQVQIGYYQWINVELNIENKDP